MDKSIFLKIPLCPCVCGCFLVSSDGHDLHGFAAVQQFNLGMSRCRSWHSEAHMRSLLSFLLLGGLQIQSLTLNCLQCFPGQPRTLGLSGSLHPTWSVLGLAIGSWAQGATRSRKTPQCHFSQRCMRRSALAAKAKSCQGFFLSIFDFKELLKDTPKL